MLLGIVVRISHDKSIHSAHAVTAIGCRNRCTSKSIAEQAAQKPKPTGSQSLRSGRRRIHYEWAATSFMRLP